MSRPYDGGTSANVVTKTANFTPGLSDHGRMFILTGSAITVALPTMSSAYKGYEFTIISGDASEHIVNGGATLMHGFVKQHGASTAGSITSVTAKSSIELDAGAIGDKFSILCDGTNWYVDVITAGAVTVA